MSGLASTAEPQLAEESGEINGVVTGTLIGFDDSGLAPLVTYPGQPGTAALAARAIVNLERSHIGRQVVLMFERGDALQPIVMGCVRKGDAWSLSEQPRQMEVDVDGTRLVVTAKEQIVLRCGKASITLTRTGKVLIEGAYVSSRATGVNRVKGGSVQLN